VTGSVQGMTLASEGDVPAEGSLNAGIILPKLPEPAESNPVEVAEIMPQYPGGVQALLSFLKKNIHSPNIEEGEDISVKIEFVVNYDGTLENFIVIKSGGDIFDTEVLRVLRKMPLWIPGKSKGKNITVHYTVPVKFINEF
jgi:protein TonB